MLIAISIFAVIAIAFVSILTVVTQVQVQSSSSSVVNQESQFLLQKLQYYVGTASIIDIPTSTPTSTLKLDVASSSLDPTLITLASGTVYLQQPSGGTLQPLTSNRVTVSNLLFTRHANPPGHDAVSISYTISYNSPSPAQEFSQLFQTSIAQVSAATFDTGLYSSAATEPLGNSTNLWSPINGIMSFTNAGNVGIDTAGAPTEPLEVNGGIQLEYQTATTTCNATYRGTLLFISPGGANKDSLYLCAANSAGTVSWQQIY